MDNKIDISNYVFVEIEPEWKNLAQHINSILKLKKTIFQDSSVDPLHVKIFFEKYNEPIIESNATEDLNVAEQVKIERALIQDKQIKDNLDYIIKKIDDKDKTDYSIIERQENISSKYKKDIKEIGTFVKNIITYLLIHLNILNKEDIPKIVYRDNIPYHTYNPKVQSLYDDKNFFESFILALKEIEKQRKLIRHKNRPRGRSKSFGGGRSKNKASVNKGKSRVKK